MQCMDVWVSGSSAEREGRPYHVASIKSRAPEARVDCVASICKLCLDIILAVRIVICFAHITY